MLGLIVQMAMLAQQRTGFKEMLYYPEIGGPYPVPRHLLADMNKEGRNTYPASCCYWKIFERIERGEKP